MRFIFIILLFDICFGQINWSNVYGETHTDEGWFISKTDDGGYILSGMEFYTAVIKKIDSSGNLIWSKTYDNPTETDGYPGDDVIKSVRQTSDGGYIATGYFENENSWSCSVSIGFHLSQTFVRKKQRGFLDQHSGMPKMRLSK